MHCKSPVNSRINFGVNTELNAAAIYTPIHPFCKEVDVIAQTNEALPEVVASTLLAAFTCVYQHWVTVSHPLNSETTVKITQYYLTLAPSGGKKSLLSDLMFKPIVEHQATLDKVNQQTPSEIKQEKEIWKAKKSALLSELKAAYKNEDENIDELEQKNKKSCYPRAQEGSPHPTTTGWRDGCRFEKSTCFIIYSSHGV